LGRSGTIIELNIVETKLNLNQIIPTMAESTSESTKEVAVNPNNLTGDVSNNPAEPTKPEDNYVKLAMRNMVRKGRQSLWHFFLTTVGLVTVLLALAFLTKP